MPASTKPTERPPARLAALAGRARALGAEEARLIPASSIVVADWVPLKCRFGCELYGTRLTCPPRSPAPEETRRVLACYRWALLFRAGEVADATQLAVALEREAFLSGCHKAFGMGAGPCSLCRSCAKRCRHPERARPAMEACGIDVFSTVRANGLALEVLADEGGTPRYHGLVLLE